MAVEVVVHDVEMGLDVIVGLMSDAGSDDPEEIAYFHAQVALINEALRGNGLPEHHEPPVLKNTFSARIGSYGDLHTLRRVAAHLWARKGLPPPLSGDENATEDPHLKALYEGETRDDRPFLMRIVSPKPCGGPAFPHLVFHGDAEGYYVPIDFPRPIVRNGPQEIIVNGLGSSLRLLRECEKLADAMSLPTSVDPEGDVFTALREGKAPSEQWQEFWVESYVCLQLLRAARESVATGAVMRFC